MHSGVPGRRVTRLAKVLVDVTWWLAILGTVLAMGLVLFWPLLTRSGLEPTTGVRVSISDEAARQLLPLTSPDTAVASDPVLEQVQARLEFRTSEWRVVALGGVAAVPGLAAVLFGLYLLRSFLAAVLSGDVFTTRNAQRLSWLGWLLITAGVVWPVLDFAYALFLVRRADVGGVPVGVSMGPLETVVPGVLVLVLAAAWRYGVELQQDHNLTV